MGAVRSMALAELRHRRLQAIVIGVVMVAACAAATLAMDTLVESQAPFDQAFAAANGAHIVLDYDPHISAAKVASTAQTRGVTGAAGPWPIASVGIEGNVGGAGTGRPGFIEGQVSGRSDPQTTVDHVTLTAGRWWRAPREIVVSQAFAQASGASVGDSIELVEGALTPGGSFVRPAGSSLGGVAAPATVSATVVGIAGSISTSNVDGWMSPMDIAALTPGQVPVEQMLYRVAPSTTTGDLAQAMAAITRGLPSGAVVGGHTYLAQRADVDRTASIFVPILLAFAAFALLAAAFLIANLVSGIVLAGYRDIGLMKALGFTPSQVVGILLGVILVPASAGSVLGVLLGTIGSQPILAQAALAFGLPAAFTLSIPVGLGVLGTAVLTATMAAAGPAIAAGRLSAVSALTRGTSPTTTAVGGRLAALARELPLPPALRVGLAAGLAHPLRAAMTLGALVVGVSALVFSLGLDGSLRLVAADLVRDQASPVRVQLDDPSTSPAKVTSAIGGLPETRRFVSIGQAQVTVPHLGSIPFVGYEGDSSWLGYALIGGRWFSGTGEAVAPTNFFTQTGTHVGDAVTLTFEGRPLTVTLVGEIFDQARENADDLVLRGEWSDLAAIDPGLRVNRWEVQPRTGANAEAYRAGLLAATGKATVSVALVGSSATNASFLLFEGVISAMGIVLIAISLGGVFNMVLLETRRRTRATAVLKALGMTPRQAVGAVVASVLPVGLLAGLIGVPLGLRLQGIVLGFMGQAAAHTAIPTSALDVLPPALLLLLGGAGLAIGALGAYLPARWAARARIAPVLQAE